MHAGNPWSREGGEEGPSNVHNFRSPMSLVVSDVSLIFLTD